VFDAVGSKTVWAGYRLGDADASALKLACSAWVGTMTAGAAQAVALARHAGIDPQLVLDTIKGGPADTPYLQIKGKGADRSKLSRRVHPGRRRQGCRPDGGHGHGYRSQPGVPPRPAIDAGLGHPARVRPGTWPRCTRSSDVGAASRWCASPAGRHHCRHRHRHRPRVAGRGSRESDSGAERRGRRSSATIVYETAILRQPRAPTALVLAKCPPFTVSRALPFRVAVIR